MGDASWSACVFILTEATGSMLRNEIAAVRRTSEQRRWEVQPAETVRPMGITLIAAIQLLKAAVLLFTATLLRLKPGTVNGPESLLYPLLYAATRGRYDSMNAALQGGNGLMGMILLLGLYLGGIGIGMLYVSPWARGTLIFSSAMTLVLFGKSCIWPDSAGAASPDMTNVYALLALDAWILVYLLRSSTAELFGRPQ